MVQLDKIFDSFSKSSLFENKFILQTSYTPSIIPHRDEQIKQVAGILAPALRGEKTSNLFVYGQTGCISGDSLVYTEIGYLPIKDMEEKVLRVLSFNKEEKKYEWEFPLFLKFTNNSKLIKIVLDNGFEIIVTKDHPLLKNNFEWSKADELKINDEVLVSFEVPDLTSNGISLSLSRVLGFIMADGSLNLKKKRIRDSKGYWYNANRQRLRYFTDDLFLLNLVKKDLESLYPHKASIIFPKKRVSHLNMTSQMACTSLCELGVPFGKKSDIIEVPKVIFNSNIRCQTEFLKAFFTSDGYVSQNTYMIELFSKSIKLLQGVSLLLHNLGIKNKIRYKKTTLNGKFFDMYRLYICGQDNLLKFYYKIGFFSEKQKKLKNLLSKYQKKMKIYDKKYVSYKITKIEETYEPYVYDLSVPKNHNFIANGIISHNTGKTLSMNYVKEGMMQRAKKNDLPLKIQYLNCKLKKVSDTEYRILAELIRKLGGNISATGLPTEQVYNKFIDIVDNEKKLLILILDEIDQAVKKISDGFLYNLTRLNSELSHSQISLIGISNDLKFLESLDPRVRSSLSEEELVFPPYNAIQLQEILKDRAKDAFKKAVLENGVIEKCAAFAAREHGDARRALDLLRVSGELAERQGCDKIKIEHVDFANEKIDKDKIEEVVQAAPKQLQLTLFSIINLSENNKEKIFTGDVYNVYHELCEKTKTEVLTQRRISDIIAEMDMLGLINAFVISKGRHGRTREIKLSIPSKILGKIKGILQESLDL